jgi:hypothetical protein
VTQIVEHLLCKFKAMSSNPSSTEKTKNKNYRQWAGQSYLSFPCHEDGWDILKKLSGTQTPPFLIAHPLHRIPHFMVP